MRRGRRNRVPIPTLPRVTTPALGAPPLLNQEGWRAERRGGAGKGNKRNSGSKTAENIVHSHHHHHHHGLAATWVVKIALVATLALVATEFVAGSLSHSLALVSDGWHNLTDVPSLILSWIALYFERRPP